MEHAHFTVDKNINRGFIFAGDPLRCDHCYQIWSADYADYAGMQDRDLIVCSCGEIVCQVGDLKTI